MGLGFSMNN